MTKQELEMTIAEMDEQEYYEAWGRDLQIHALEDALEHLDPSSTEYAEKQAELTRILDESEKRAADLRKAHDDAWARLEKLRALRNKDEEAARALNDEYHELCRKLGIRDE